MHPDPLTPSPTRRTRNLPALTGIITLIILCAAATLCAILFAPRKPMAPHGFTMTFAAPPAGFTPLITPASNPAPTSGVWGYVTRQDGQPVTGATVLFCTQESLATQALTLLTQPGGDTPPAATTSENGAFLLPNVPQGQILRLHVLASDLAPRLTDPFSLDPAHPWLHADITLDPGSQVQGSVIDANGTPIAGAEVICMPGYRTWLDPVRGPKAFRRAISDPSGQFTLRGLPPGELQIMAFIDRCAPDLTGTRIFTDGYRNLTGINVVLQSCEPE